MTFVPEHVRAAFHAESGDPMPLGYAWDYGFRVGNVVLSPVVDPDNASWSAKVRENLNVEGLRIARPVRSADGRFVVSGWRATSFDAGELVAGRVDETVIAGLRLADALANVPTPEFLQHPVSTKWKAHEIYRVADQAAWSEDPGQVLVLGLDPESMASAALESALVLAARLTPLVPSINAPAHVGHADMMSTTLYSSSQAPLVTDLVATVHPHGYTAAQAVVDGLLFDAVDPGIVYRFAHVPDFTALLMRALLYRVFIFALQDDDRNDMSERLQKVADILIYS